MSSYVVWIDQEHAKIFKFLPGGKTENQSVQRHTHEHHSAPDQNHQKGHDAFYHDVASHLKSAQEILLVGPGLGRDHFRTHLEKHHHAELLKHVIGSVAMDHLTDPQIIAEARKVFKKKDLFL